MRARQLEKTLIKGMLGGDESAIDEFCRDYVPQVFRFALRRLRGDEQLAEEVAQSTVCKAIAQLSTFRGEAALVSWLYAVCRNEIAQHFRRRQRRGVHLALDAAGQDSPSVLADPASPNPETATFRSEGKALVHETLDSLPPHYGKVLEMKYIEEMSTKEIALLLGLHVKAAESLLTRARDRFRARFSERDCRPARASHRQSPFPYFSELG